MSDDFFSRDDDNDGRAPPKAAGSLAANTAVRQRKGPPPPPPRRPAATEATSTPATTASAAATRPRPTPSRPSPAATATSTSASTANPATTTSASTSASTTRPRPTPRATTARAKPNTGNNPTGTANPSLPTARSSTRTAPVMSRPVGQYYAADTASYSKPHAHGHGHAEETSPEDTWDWGTQTPAPAPTQTPQSWAAPNPHSWAAPATDSTAASSTSGDWYATDTHSQTNANGMYSFNSSGFYGATNPQPTEPNHDAFFSGRMDDAPVAPAPTVFQPKPFVPQAHSTQSSSNFMTGEEAPLLEELGINLEHIGMKTKAVILPFSRFGGVSMEPADIVKDADLAGPIAFCLILGAEMVLTGKLQFGYIYGFGVFGCASMTLIVNLMSPLAEGISIWTVSSVLGYALIPVNLLAAVKLTVINLGNLQSFGRFLGLLTVAWSTIASTRLLELGFGLREQRYLIAYPVALLYSAFVLITIF